MMVQLTEEQVKALKEMAKVRKTPVAKLVRESVTYFVASSTQLSEQERQKRGRAIRSIAGKYRDIQRVKDLSTNHDKYLEDAFAS